jgi:transcriptional regulator with XRE-family HTH domain
MDVSPSDPLLGFATRLRALRLERGLSQEALAAVAGLDRTYVSSCEAGRRNVTLRTICRLATALQVDASVLVSGLCSQGSEIGKA